MIKLCEGVFLWGVGGSIYYLIEIVFRGFSHWSMFILGGICFVYISAQGLAFGWQEPLYAQIARCTIFVTAAEFSTGIIVNKWMHQNVWDYSGMPLNLFGQICFPFAVLFSGLSALGIILGGHILYRVYGKKKPVFQIV